MKDNIVKEKAIKMKEQNIPIIAEIRELKERKTNKDRNGKPNLNNIENDDFITIYLFRATKENLKERFSIAKYDVYDGFDVNFYILKNLTLSDQILSSEKIRKKYNIPDGRKTFDWPSFFKKYDNMPDNFVDELVEKRGI